MGKRIELTMARAQERLERGDSLDGVWIEAVSMDGPRVVAMDATGVLLSLAVSHTDGISHHNSLRIAWTMVARAVLRRLGCHGLLPHECEMFRWVSFRERESRISAACRAIQFEGEQTSFSSTWWSSTNGLACEGVEL